MTLNEMMDRPIVEERVLNFLRHGQRDLPEEIMALKAEAAKRRVPVIPYETAVFLDFLLALKKPQRLLEVGTAIGYSAMLMALNHPERQVETIERNPKMAKEAKERIRAAGLGEQITLHFGDAKDQLQELHGPYDFIFLDSAKASYIAFLPHCLKLLAPGGLIMLDDVFQAGTVFLDRRDIPRRVRRIHDGLVNLRTWVAAQPDLISTYLPLGDGVLLLQRKE